MERGMKQKKSCRLFSAFALGLSLGVFFISYTHASDIIDITKIYQSSARRISMDFKNAPLSDVLKIFSQQSGLNFIASSEIAEKIVNLYLDNVPAEEALERILAADSLTYELQPDSNVFIVKSVKKPAKELITRVYPLKNATVPSSKLRSTLSASDKASSSSSAASSTGTTSTTTGIIYALKSLLTEDGSIIEDPRTNSLIVTDIPGIFPMVEQTIARLDVRIPQILIEVEMLDISKKTADLLGAKWGDTPVTFHGAERDTLFPFNTDNLVDHGGIKFENPQYRVATLALSGLKYSLQFLRTQTDTKNLARPRILTLNNETAEIRIKTDEAIGLASSTTSTEGTASSVQEAERVETGIFLKVTPQANIETSEITMAIEPKVIEATAGATFGTQNFKDPEERGTKSILRINDNDTIIIGGLLRTDIQEIRTRIPFLGDVPFLGAAFRHKDRKEEERELVIFITPHIVKEESASLTASSDSGLAGIEKSSTEITVSSDKRLKEMERELSLIEGRF